MGPHERDLELSVRGVNIAKSLGATTVRDLVRFTPDQLLSARCFGDTSLREITERLAERGLRLGMTMGEFAAMKGLDGNIVVRGTGGSKPGSELEHEAACCGHCEHATKQLRERTEAELALEATFALTKPLSKVPQRKVGAQFRRKVRPVG